MRVLAIDTALGACQAAVLVDGAVRAALSQPMARGHQERLAPLVAEAMAAAGLAFADIERIGVTVGPGSFTGLRVGLAFAKGLGVALEAPVLGIGTLAALAWRREPGGRSVAVADAGRGRAYLQAFDAATPLGEAVALPLEDALARVRALRPDRLVGPGAALLAAGFAGEVDARAAPDPAGVAAMAAASRPEDQPARPLYLRAPDARTLAERRADAAAAAR